MQAVDASIVKNSIPLYLKLPETRRGSFWLSYALSTDHATVSSLSAANGAMTTVIRWGAPTLPWKLFNWPVCRSIFTKLACRTHLKPKCVPIHGTRRKTEYQHRKPRVCTLDTCKHGPLRWNALSGLDQTLSPHQGSAPRGGLLPYKHSYFWPLWGPLLWPARVYNSIFRIQFLTQFTMRLESEKMLYRFMVFWSRFSKKLGIIPFSDPKKKTVSTIGDTNWPKKLIGKKFWIWYLLNNKIFDSDCF